MLSSLCSICVKERALSLGSSRACVIRRMTSSSASTTSSETSRLVISRRGWQAIKSTLPSKPRLNTKPKIDDKPWPRSVKIAGYVTGGIFVPYTIIWLITSNPTLRKWFGPYLPMNRFRSHFGHLEWDVQSYTDEMNIDEMNKRATSKEIGTIKSDINVEFYQFPEEPSFRERQQQNLIDDMDQTNIRVNMFVSESDGQQSIETKTIPANTLANAKNLIRLLQGTRKSASQSLSSKTTTSVAVTFDEGNASETVNHAHLLMESNLPDEKSGIHTNPAWKLLKETQIFSSWYSVPDHQMQEETSTTADIDMEISRLEYTVSDLEKSLKDPTGTRDMDEMATELKQAKRELSRLKWKRRLGFFR